MSEVQRNLQTRRRLEPRRLVDLDLLLTDAFLVYASHLLSGRVNPLTFDAEWHVVNSKEVDIPAVLEKALDSHQVSEALESLRPSEKAYVQLKDALVRYRKYSREGNWPQVPDGVKLEDNDAGDRVLALRRRLEATGDLEKVETAQPDVFDTVLEDAVKRFQRRHGLDDDGVVGKGTLAALNVPAKDRARQIELNLERWRWLPRDLGRQYILVNIAGFALEVIDSDRLVLEMRVVVGRPYRRTPVFSAPMTYLVFSPYWHVPANLAVQDIVPAILKEPDYLAKKNIRVFQGWGVDTQEIDPATIDWSSVNRRHLPYRFRQEPGPNNSLGGVKFMFPNAFDVSLHDTPSRELFQRAERTFSSGCIRIEKPLELAEYLLSEASSWNSETVQAAARKGVEQTVRLPEPIAVHLLYWTSWIDREGNIQFRNDVYGRDRWLDEALREKPPTVD
jgi:murein L,D-transpeptidase YcbB/YkuD